jgi:hypothetical protein
MGSVNEPFQLGAARSRAAAGAGHQNTPLKGANNNMNHRAGYMPTRRDTLSVEIWATDRTGVASLLEIIEINAVELMVNAMTREDLARTKGRAFTAGAVPYRAGELIKAIHADKSATEVQSAAINAAIAVWLVDLVFEGVSPEAFMNSNLRFTMLPGGAVRYDRVPA